VTDYIVDMQCPKCGELHRLSNGLLLENGPTKTGSLAELYGSRPLPLALVGLLTDLAYCETLGEWVQQWDRAWVFLQPLQRCR
jgi:hypothetical protein